MSKHGFENSIGASYGSSGIRGNSVGLGAQNANSEVAGVKLPKSGGQARGTDKGAGSGTAKDQG